MRGKTINLCSYKYSKNIYTCAGFGGLRIGVCGVRRVSARDMVAEMNIFLGSAQSRDVFVAGCPLRLTLALIARNRLWGR